MIILACILDLFNVIIDGMALQDNQPKKHENYIKLDRWISRMMRHLWLLITTGKSENAPVNSCPE